MADVAQRLANLSPAQRKLLEQRLKDKPTVAQPIAVVGIACRLPGANNPEEYWDLITNQRTTFEEIPNSRWDIERFYDEEPEASGKMSTKWASTIEDIDHFDSLFFGIAPREAVKMDPQQRILLETTWEAIENSGIAPDELAGTSTGVFVGIGATDYAKVPVHFANYYDVIDAHIGTGNALSVASNRISYLMDFRGPSMSIDTACSSGSVALHYAVQELRNGTCDAAVTGAVNAIIVPDVTIAFSKARMLSPTGACRPFDASANGYVRGEGCVSLLLKRLTDATRDGDNVLAVIRSTAINQDGRTSGITAPNALSQQACIRSAHSAAGITADDVTYIEAHGTGTPLGDPIEFQSLSKIFPQANGKKPVYVTSAKANIGHTETVSGVAGLLKVIMMMQKGVIPPHTGLTEVNPNIKLDGSRLVIPTEHVEWSKEAPRIAGVSSFGFGGTNSHIIVEAATPQPTEDKSEVPERPMHVLAISARTKPALPQVAANYRDALRALDGDQLGDFCDAVNAGRAHFNHRAALVAETREALIDQLDAVANEKRNPNNKLGDVQIAGKPRVAMLFTGQGSQYAGMGKTLYDAHPVFRDSIDKCDEILQPLINRSLKDVVFADTEGLINQTAFTQPALFALEYSMAKLWESWGIRPSVMLGHSVGEYVAACLAGVFSLEDGLKLLAKRAELMQQLPPNGAMAVIFANRETVEARLVQHGEDVAVATANGPENNVISGKTELVEKIVAEFEAEGIGTQKLRVSHAFHSPLMDPMLEEFERFAAEITFNKPTIPIVANRTGKIVETADFDAAYWRDHIRNAVEFNDGMLCLADEKIDAFLEVGPAASLLGMGKRCLPDSNAAWVSSMRKGRAEWKTVLTAVAELYALGIKLDWTAFDAPWNRKFIQLPNYPFQRQPYWYVEEGTSPASFGPSVHPLLGSAIKTALKSTVYETRMAGDSPNYLRDHVVQGSAVTPGAAYVEMGLGAAEQVFGEGTHAVENIAIQQGMFLPVEGAREVETITGADSGGRANYEVYSIDGQSEVANQKWLLHVTGTIVHADTVKARPTPKLPDLDDFRKSAVYEMAETDVYELFASRSLTYGPCFQVIGEMMRNNKEAIAQVQLHESVRSKLEKYHVHPCVGDAMMQAVAGVVPLGLNNEHAPYTYVPMQVGQFRKHKTVEGDLWIYAVRTSDDDGPSPEVVVADVFLLTPDNEIVAEARDVTVQRVGRSILDEVVTEKSDWMHRIEWQTADTLAAPEAISQPVVVFGEGSGLGEAIIQDVKQRGGTAALVRFGAASELKETDGVWTAALPATDADPYDNLLNEIADKIGTQITTIYCGALDGAALATGKAADLPGVIDASCAAPLRLIQALTRNTNIKKASVTLVTDSAVSVDGEATKVGQTPLWGFGRVAALEAAELNCRMVDVTNAPNHGPAIINEATIGDDENQIAYREGKRHVARVVESPEHLGASSDGTGMAIPTNSDYRLRIRTAGSFDALYYEPYEAVEPGPGQVELDIRATGLNFSDVLKALGLYPGIKDVIVPMGIECSGVVRSVGEGVTDFQPGDEVMGVVPYAFASRGVTNDYALTKKPANIDDEEASTIPITFLTAYYGLVRLADLQKGELVLIHAGAGGVGLAAIQIAKAIGAEIFATAGSDEKRDYLKSLGVHHVMNSRTLEFADQIAEITNHEGIDVVLNSLPGDAIEKSIGCLRAYGRFLEIGKTDIYSNSKIGLLPFQDNLSYFAIDLDRMLRQRGAYIRGLYAELMQHFEAGTYTPLPFTQFETSDTIGAFRYMAQRKNIGKVVVSMQPAASGDDAAVQSLISSEGTYLITGGLGALGLKVAEQMISEGATSVALLSRRAPDDAKQARINELAKDGAKVIAVQGDVSDVESLKGAISQIPSDAPPLKGVVHAAGVLADGVLFDMDLEQLNLPLVSKIVGTWNLHEATQSHELDFFVMFSSIACVLGSPGQSNYAAGNSFLDGMVAYRRSMGQPATSINWGPWAESGMAAEQSRDTQLSNRGMHLLPAEEALEVFTTLLNNQTPNSAVMSVNWADLVQAMGGTVQPILKEVASNVATGGEEASAEDKAFRQALLGMEPAARLGQLTTFFATQLANIMGMEVDDVDVVAPLNTMGMDSLMAIELKNKIERRLQTTLPMSALMHDPSVTSLAEYLSENYGDSDDGAEATSEESAPSGSTVSTRSDEPSRVVRPHSTQSLRSDA